jgi:hypothetical protein
LLRRHDVRMRYVNEGVNGGRVNVNNDTHLPRRIIRRTSSACDDVLMRRITERVKGGRMEGQQTARRAGPRIR